MGELQHLLTHRDTSRGHEAEPEPFPVARVDAVGATAAAGLLEQASRTGRLIAIPAPVGPVVGLAREEDRAVERATSAHGGLAQDRPRDRHTIDPERERLANELTPERGMAPGTHPKHEVLHHGARPRGDPPARDLHDLTSELLTDGRSADGESEVELAAAERPERIARVEIEAEDEAVEVRRVRAPVARVPDERELLATLESPDEEGAAPDRCTGLRVVDPVDPHLRQVLSNEGVAREHDRIQVLPVGKRVAQLDLERLRAEDARSPDLAVELSHVECRGLEGDVLLVGEAEVGCRDRDSVRPARVRPDVIRERERLPVDRNARDEVRPRDEIGTDLERPLENLGQSRVVVTEVASEGIEAGHLRTGGDNGPAAFRRLHARSARSRDGEERDDDRRC